MSCFAVSVMKLGTCYDSAIHPRDSDRSTSVFPAPRKAAGEGRWARSWSVHALVHLAFAGESLVSAAAARLSLWLCLGFSSTKQRF